ncbi:MAG: tryptophan--tRNA ligase [Polyangiales bacterium]
MKVALTGIKPTATPHLGNYMGAIRPALALAEAHRALYFIADYHALTSVRDPAALQSHVYDVAATWLACGLDPSRTLLFRQSDVPEHCELMWILSCLVAVGQLERGHAYKDALAQGGAPNAGLFLYPVLMSADILLYDADVVPVGRDQLQHLELTRDLAQRLNHLYGADLVRVPEAQISHAAVLPGTDGRKMSKSHGNTLPLFATRKQLRRAVMGIVSDSTPLEAPKEPNGATVCTLYRIFASEADVETLEAKLRAGGFGWGHAKEALFEELDAMLAPFRERYAALRRDEAGLDGVLQQGAAEARRIAQRTLGRVRAAVGMRPHVLMARATAPAA